MKTPKYIPKWFRDLCEKRAYDLKKITGMYAFGQTGRTENAFVRMCWAFYWDGRVKGREDTLEATKTNTEKLLRRKNSRLGNSRTC